MNRKLINQPFIPSAIHINNLHSRVASVYQVKRESLKSKDLRLFCFGNFADCKSAAIIVLDGTSGLTAIDTPDRIQAALIGHKFDRPKYGDGPTLELKAEWMKKISLKNLI